MLNPAQPDPQLSTPVWTTPNAGQHITGLPKFLVDLKYLWLEQILEVRTTWYVFLVFSIILPISMVFGFSRMGTGLNDTSSLLYIISGSAIFAVASDGLYTMATRIGSMKKDGTLVYYASLPISKVAFLMAIVFSRLIVTLPGMIAPMLFGHWLYGVDLQLNVWLLFLLPLNALALSAVGLAIGALIDSMDMILMIVNIIMLVLIMAAPVFMPMQSLPVPLQILAYFLPPTYAADALRQALAGTFGTSFYFDVAMLIGITLVSFYVMNRWLSWRQK
ncbi:MAG: ABC transporter permease [Chloroflexota bacterium]